eukprot:CAMPEP_0201501114 /NCGR_PEP_ID=MMETSP0151_2-20130828/83415_1 /ASSEMBLY_ACC=CAM_ASM_000257 /TAXON_ID=200890 /ORGANISM="Paramoeba atlantica, Strain 621/1 / CCAP 1560/9" /LENGTH=297 /DNA_ID=CAMNT_0047894593 /DNA_START=67 /DNA_END=958 /DNA_ORIENTATION=-
MPLLFFKDFEKDVTDFFTSPHGFSLLTRTPGADRSPYLNHAITPDPINNNNNNNNNNNTLSLNLHYDCAVRGLQSVLGLTNKGTASGRVTWKSGGSSGSSGSGSGSATFLYLVENLCTFFFSLFSPTPLNALLFFKDFEKDVTDFFTSPHGFSLLTRTPGADRSPYLNHAITPDPINNNNNNNTLSLNLHYDCAVRGLQSVLGLTNKGTASGRVTWKSGGSGGSGSGSGSSGSGSSGSGSGSATATATTATTATATTTKGSSGFLRGFTQGSRHTVTLGDSVGLSWPYPWSGWVSQE